MVQCFPHFYTNLCILFLWLDLSKFQCFKKFKFGKMGTNIFFKIIHHVTLNQYKKTLILCTSFFKYFCCNFKKIQWNSFENNNFLPKAPPAYKTAPIKGFSGVNPKAIMYIIWAMEKHAIPAVKRFGHTRNASPMQLNTSPVRILLEKVYLETIFFSL